MARHIRGVRSVPRKVMGVIAAGRSLEEQIADVRRYGIIFTPDVLRNSILGGLEVPRRRKASNLIIVGCACYGTAMPLRNYCLLLERLGIEYAFLDKEYCCGLPFIQHQVIAGEDRKPADEAAREFIGMNIEGARRVGSQRIIYFCTWCAYLGKRFYPEFPQLFYPEALYPALDGVRLVLRGVVGYFGGTPHRRPILVPEDGLDLDWPGYRRLLDRIEGLEVVDIPRYCCQIADWAIWDRLRRHGLDTLVVSCIVCYGRLSRRAPQGIRVRFLTDIILEALEV